MGAEHLIVRVLEKQADEPERFVPRRPISGRAEKSNLT
jgi:hypothetical protein